MAKLGADLTPRGLTTLDSAAVQQLVIECAPLTLHTPYTYWVMLEYGGELSRGVWEGERLAGVALVVPAASDAALVWQLGVSPAHRGRGVAGAMLRAAWDERPSWVTRFETTIDPANLASRAAFAGLARARGIEMRDTGVAEVRGPGGNVAEREVRYRLG